MKTYLLLAICLVLAGCGGRKESEREVLSKLDALKSELGKHGAPVRWATIRKRDIDTVIYQRVRERTEQFNRSEALSADMEAEIAGYERLKSELMQMRIGQLAPLPVRAQRLAPGVEPVAPVASTNSNQEYEALSKRIADARVPIAAIVDRRDRQAAQYRQEYKLDAIIAEYVKGRFDLVVDNDHFGQSPVVYRTALEVTDITDGVLELLKEKGK